MRDFAIMTDSCCDLASAMAEELDLSVLPLSLHLGGSVYRNWLDGRDIGFPEFYGRVRGGETASTAAVSVGDFDSEMRKILQSGRDILCISFSSALSATFQSASIAAEDLRQEFPEARIYVVDSLCASLGQGLLVWLCAREREKGRTLEEVRAFSEETKGRICHWITSSISAISLRWTT